MSCHETVLSKRESTSTSQLTSSRPKEHKAETPFPTPPIFPFLSGYQLDVPSVADSNELGSKLSRESNDSGFDLESPCEIYLFLAAGPAGVQWTVSRSLQFRFDLRNLVGI